MSNIKSVLLVLVLGLFLAACSQVAEVPQEGLESTAQTGTYDPTFDKDGRLLLNVGGFRSLITDIVVQQNGKIVAISFREDTLEKTVGVIARFLPDGQLDPSFDGDGQFIFEGTLSLSNIVIPKAVALGPNGRIFVVATGIRTTSNFPNEKGVRPIVLALTASGQPDPSFDSNGFAFPVTQLEALKGADITGDDIHVDSLGFVTIGGTASPENGNSVLWTWKTGPNGPGTSAGQGVESTESVPGRDATFRAFAVKGRGEMVMLADTITAVPGLPGLTPFLVSKAADGTTLVKRHLTFGDTAWARDVTFDREGRVVFTAGFISGPFNGHGVVARVNFADLTLDPSFYGGGKHILWVKAVPRDVRVDSQGRIVMAVSGGNTFAVLRLLPNGGWDTGFASGGAAKMVFEGGPDFGNALTFDRAGRIVAGGQATQKSSGQSHFALTRLIP